MMISTEEYYKETLKGKTKEQIMTTIRGLKQEIGHLKNMIERQDSIEEPIMKPSEDKSIHWAREYLKKAKRAFTETGGTYKLSKSEEKARDFDANTKALYKIIFNIGGFPSGQSTYVAELSDFFKVYTKSWENKEPIDLFDNKHSFTKDTFIALLMDLHIGEWRNSYSPKPECRVCDGTQWELEFQYINGHKSLIYDGNNSYPYNFKKFQMLFGIDDTANEEDE